MIALQVRLYLIIPFPCLQAENFCPWEKLRRFHDNNDNE